MTSAVGSAERDAIDEAHAAIRARSTLEPGIALVLGTGLGRLATEIDVEAEIPFGEIPHFVTATFETGRGRLLLGRLDGRAVAALDGRLHAYEGYSLNQVTRPIRVLRMLGCSTLIVSNIAGGMNPLWQLGDIVLLDDHINLIGDNPLIGPNLDELGPRFPDMTEPYDRGLQRVAERVALAERIALRHGVYVAVAGPNLETRAEYRLLRAIGADVVGMSTVPEVIVARHMGMRVLGLSVITDLCLPDALEIADVASILRVAQQAEPKLATLVRGVLAQLA